MSSFLRPRFAGAAAVLVLIIAACTTEASPLASPLASPTQSQTPSPEPAASAPVTPGAEPAQTPPPATFGAPGGFSVASNPEADALFGDRDDCQNLEDGYQLQFPEEWYTNTEIGSVPACSWFSPTFYEVDDPSDLPAEIAIQFFVLNGDRGYITEPISREEIIVGSTQEAVRIEVAGTSNSDDGTMYEYVVQLGPTLEEGPNLVARTDTDMGGDYELNKAVLDRIMATIEFIGTIQ